MGIQTKTVVSYTDDLTGAEVNESDITRHTFALDGKSYEIWLTEKSFAKMREAFREFSEAGAESSSRTQVGSTRRARRSTEEVEAEKAQKAAHSEYLNKVRSWAGKNGISVGEKGRIAQTVLDAYEKATA